ncbi:MAG: hypothetical protein ABIG44_11055 [Planctomycetota bacterium]
MTIKAEQRITRHAEPAALLLEVVVALTIMVSAMGVLGAQLVNGVRLTADADRLTRAAALTDRLLALVEMDPEMQESLLLEEQADGEFGDQYPGWFWEIEFQPVESVEGLGQVRVAVLYQEDPGRIDSDDGATLIRQVVLLKAAPGRVDLVEDFGMDELQVEELTALLPLADFDPSAVDPQMLVAALTENPELLLELLPELMPLLQQYMANSGGLAGMMEGGIPFSPGDLAGQLGGLEGMIGEEPKKDGDDVGGKDTLPGDMPAVDGFPGMRDQGMGGAARGGRGTRGGGRGGDAQPGGRGGRGGGSGDAQPGGRGDRGSGAQDGPPRYTIEDLMRMRDEMTRQGGG